MTHTSAGRAAALLNGDTEDTCHREAPRGRRRGWVALAGALLLVACGGTGGEVVPGTLTVVAADVGNTEGVAIAPDGTAYVVQRKLGLLRLDHDGTTTQLARFDKGIGATWWKGAVWVAQPTIDEQAGALLEITPAGEVTRHEVTDPPAPNFLAPTPWGTLLVADDTVDTLYEWDPASGATSAWADVPSPNGTAFSPDDGTVWVASTFRQPGLWAIPVSGHVAGTPAQVVSFGNGTAPDGLAVARDGSVLVALNVAGTIAVVKDGALVDTLVPEPFALTPASLAFGRGGWDPRSVLTTELLGQDVVSIAVGMSGHFPAWAD